MFLRFMKYFFSFSLVKFSLCNTRYRKVIIQHFVQLNEAIHQIGSKLRYSKFQIMKLLRVILTQLSYPCIISQYLPNQTKPLRIQFACENVQRTHLLVRLPHGIHSEQGKLIPKQAGDGLPLGSCYQYIRRDTLCNSSRC